MEQMVRIKVLSNFFQVSELTTLVSLPWPAFAKWTLPLQFPTSDTECLNSTGWNLIYKFYSFVYIPILAFVILGLKYKRSSPRSLKREELSQTGIFLLTMWYSPVLQAVASVNACNEDQCTGKMYFAEDPALPCEGLSHFWLRVHQYLIDIFIGFGLPLFIFWKMLLTFFTASGHNWIDWSVENQAWSAFVVNLGYLATGSKTYALLPQLHRQGIQSISPR